MPASPLATWATAAIWSPPSRVSGSATTGAGPNSAPAGSHEHRNHPIRLDLVVGIGRVVGNGSIPPPLALLTAELANLDVEGLRPVLDGDRLRVGQKVVVPDRMGG